MVIGLCCLRVAMLLVNVNRSHKLLQSLNSFNNLLEVASMSDVIDWTSELRNLLGICDDFIEVVAMINSMLVNWSNQVLEFLSMLDDFLKKPSEPINNFTIQ